MKCITATISRARTLIEAAVSRARAIITGTLYEFCPIDVADFLQSYDDNLVKTDDGYYVAIPSVVLLETCEAYIVRTDDNYHIQVE